MTLLPLGAADVPRILALMRKYRDRPRDVADAALVAVAEREGVRTVFAADRGDFTVTGTTAGPGSPSFRENPASDSGRSPAQGPWKHESEIRIARQAHSGR